jgi:hypothetical protein
MGFISYVAAVEQSLDETVSEARHWGNDTTIFTNWWELITVEEQSKCRL